MHSSYLSARRRVLVSTSVAAVLTLALNACGSSSMDSAKSGMDHGAKPAASASPASSTAPTATPSTGGMSDMDGMDGMSADDGLSAASGGYRLTSETATLPAGSAPGYRFSITGPDGRPVTDFAVDQTQRLHFYAIRSDLTGFQHLHPTMAPDGTWTAPLTALAPGNWRLFASFTPGSGTGSGSSTSTGLVLSRTVTVPGQSADTPLPPAASSASVDGYTVTVVGEPMAGMAHELTITVSKDGQPVTDLQPYLDSYAHLTAFHAGDTAFAHLHPQTTAGAGEGGPSLTFHAELATSGDWRLFLQFQTAGTLHTAALTLHVA